MLSALVGERQAHCIRAFSCLVPESMVDESRMRTYQCWSGCARPQSQYARLTTIQRANLYHARLLPLPVRKAEKIIS